MTKLKLLLMLGIIISMLACNEELIEERLQPDKIESRQYTDQGFRFMDPCDVHDITYFVNDNCDGTVYEDAIVAAINKYNTAPIPTRFREVFTLGQADIVFSCIEGPECGSGYTNFDDDEPSTANASIDLHIDWETCPCTDETDCNFVDETIIPDCVFIKTVMHEMGHALGFKHNGSGIGGDHVPGTPFNSYDENSIFNSGYQENEHCVWCVDNCDFNENDLLAIQTVYCGCKYGLFVDGNVCIIGDEVTYCVPEQLEVENWQIPDNMSVISETANCITLELDAYGGIEIVRIDIVDNGCLSDFNPEIIVNTLGFPMFSIEYTNESTTGTGGSININDVLLFTIVPSSSHQNLTAINWSTTSDAVYISSSNSSSATVDVISSGTTGVCATVVNECGAEKTICYKIAVS